MREKIENLKNPDRDVQVFDRQTIQDKQIEQLDDALNKMIE